MQRAMWTVLEWPQSNATSKTTNMITNKYEQQEKCRLGTVSKKLLGGLNHYVNQSKATYDVGAPKVYRRIYWRKFLTLSNQTLRYLC